MFDEKVKPFEKLTGIQKDTVRLAWFVTGANLRSVVRKGNLVSRVDLNATSDLQCHVNDVWANEDELEQYFEADASINQSELVGDVAVPVSVRQAVLF